jgi:hypothetical protein
MNSFTEYICNNPTKLALTTIFHVRYFILKYGFRIGIHGINGKEVRGPPISEHMGEGDRGTFDWVIVLQFHPGHSGKKELSADEYIRCVSKSQDAPINCAKSNGESVRLIDNHRCGEQHCEQQQEY